MLVAVAVGVLVQLLVELLEKVFVQFLVSFFRCSVVVSGVVDCSLVVGAIALKFSLVLQNYHNKIIIILNKEYIS